LSADLVKALVFLPAQVILQLDLAKKEWGDVVRELMLEKNESTSK
jgi:hypothetical protein